VGRAREAEAQTVSFVTLAAISVCTESLSFSRELGAEINSLSRTDAIHFVNRAWKVRSQPQAKAQESHATAVATVIRERLQMKLQRGLRERVQWRAAPLVAQLVSVRVAVRVAVLERLRGAARGIARRRGGCAA